MDLEKITDNSELTSKRKIIDNMYQNDTDNNATMSDDEKSHLMDPHVPYLTFTLLYDVILGVQKKVS